MFSCCLVQFFMIRNAHPDRSHQHYNFEPILLSNWAKDKLEQTKLGGSFQNECLTNFSCSVGDSLLNVFVVVVVVVVVVVARVIRKSNDKSYHACFVSQYYCKPEITLKQISGIKLICYLPALVGPYQENFLPLQSWVHTFETLGNMVLPVGK